MKMEGGSKKTGCQRWAFVLDEVVGIPLQLELHVVGRVQLGPSACQVYAFISQPRPPRQMRKIFVALVRSNKLAPLEGVCDISGQCTPLGRVVC